MPVIAELAEMENRASAAPESDGAASDNASAQGTHPIDEFVRERFVPGPDTIIVRELLHGRKVRYADREETCSPEAAAFVVGENMRQFEPGSTRYYSEYKTAVGTVCHISEAADKVAAALDRESLCALLKDLARQEGNGFFIPYGRYADGAQIAELIGAINKQNVVDSDSWVAQRKNCIAARSGLLLSDTREAMLYLEKVGQLEAYAGIRGTDADTVRDCVLSDIGLDEQGGKTYDLGNQIVTVRLQRDLSFLVELPNGKTAKSIPKRGSEPEKYAQTKADFAEMKRLARKIVKSRGDVLFDAFLSGETRGAASWKSAYLGNPLLRYAAGALVWVQGGNTFTLSENGAIDSAGASYELTEEPVQLAHPMEMPQGEAEAWQRYFSAHGIKQPFPQIWEPVCRPEEIRPDRYQGAVQPMLRFANKERHGIMTYGLKPYSEKFGFALDGCQLTFSSSVSWRLGHDGAAEETFTLGTFTFDRYTRRVNHIVALLDGWTAEDRVRKDDIGVMDQMSGFTLAQITEFIAIAQEANAVNVLALLLEYKKDRFVGFDPMEEFTLDL